MLWRYDSHSRVAQPRPPSRRAPLPPTQSSSISRSPLALVACLPTGPCVSRVPSSVQLRPSWVGGGQPTLCCARSNLDPSPACILRFNLRSVTAFARAIGAAERERGLILYPWFGDIVLM